MRSFLLGDLKQTNLREGRMKMRFKGPRGSLGIFQALRVKKALRRRNGGTLSPYLTGEQRLLRELDRILRRV